MFNMSTNLNETQRKLTALMLGRRFDEAVRLLQEEPALSVNFTFNIPKMGRTKVTPLMLACRLAAKQLIGELLLRSPEVVGELDGCGNSALHYLVSEKDSPEVRETIAHTLLGLHGELLKVSNQDGDLPIHEVVERANSHAAAWLLSYDESQKEHQNRKGLTPLQALHAKQDPELMRAFHEQEKQPVLFLGPQSQAKHRPWQKPLLSWSKENHAHNDAHNAKSLAHSRRTTKV